MEIPVILVPDGTYCFAQGLRIDYATQGITLEETRLKFVEGLKTTLKLWDINKVYWLTPCYIRDELLKLPGAIIENVIID